MVNAHSEVYVVFASNLLLVGRGGDMGAVSPIVKETHIEMHSPQPMPRNKHLRRGFALVAEQADSNPVCFFAC